jgi:hypothetical protein
MQQGLQEAWQGQMQQGPQEAWQGQMQEGAAGSMLWRATCGNRGPISTTTAGWTSLSAMLIISFSVVELYLILVTYPLVWHNMLTWILDHNP